MKRPLFSDLATGAVAGVVGTAAMDVVWWRRARNAGSDDGFVEWQFGTGTEYDSFEDASTPAQMGQRLARIVGIELPVERAGLTTDVMHWTTGIGWGTAAGALTAATPVAAVPAGIAGGVAAIGTAYGVLGAAGIYQPVWEYDLQTLWKDLSAHLVFGTALGAALFAIRKLRTS